MHSYFKMFKVLYYCAFAVCMLLNPLLALLLVR